MRKCREVRHILALPVRVWGMDAQGAMFEQYATTVNVTTSGAHLAGIEHRLQRGCVIGIEHCSSRARYRIAWVGSQENGKAGEIGVQLIEIGKFIWGRVIPRVFASSYAAESPNQMAASDDYLGRATQNGLNWAELESAGGLDSAAAQPRSVSA